MSSLRPTAAAFVPSISAVASLQPLPNVPPGLGQVAAGQQGEQQQQQQQAQQTQHCTAHATQDDVTEEAYEDDDGYYDDLGNWVQYDGTDNWPQEWQHYSSSTWQEQPPGTTQQEDNEDDAVWQYTEDNNEQAVQLLHSWLPSQPLLLLRQLLDACDGHLQEALQIVSEMDSEQQQQQTQHTSAAKAAAHPGNKQQQKLSLQDDALFPALPAAAAQQQQPAARASPASYHAGFLWGDKTACAKGSSSSNTRSWSALAKAAAAATTRSEPASCSPASTSRGARGMSTNKLSSGSAASRSAAAGVDAAEQHSVPWVQTGEAVAQEYAAARAEANDYARVRNACFQQATQAYLAGKGCCKG
jgi:hypothetical protein